jgi:rhodanese-related sulfurtransferase
MINQTLKEISILFGCTLFLSFAHTLLSRQGFFQPAVPHPKAVSAKNLEMISLSDAKELYHGGTVLFIDARHEYDFKQGSIQGAINIPLSDFDTLRPALNKIPRDKRIVVYCNGEQCNSSLELAAKLSELGFTNINIFFGGWQEWSSAGLPISK